MILLVIHELLTFILAICAIKLNKIRKPTYIKTIRGLGYKLEEPKGMNKFRSRLLYICFSHCVYFSWTRFIARNCFENYYINHAKERMVKETEYVAVLAEEQGFDDVLKIRIFEKLEEKIPASILFVDEKIKFNIAKGNNLLLAKRWSKNFPLKQQSKK